MKLRDFLGLTEEAIVSIKIAIYAIFGYLGIDGDVVEVLFFLMCADTILGATKAVVLGRPFSFKKLLWGMVTKMAVLIIPMIIALVAKGLSFDFKWFVLAILNVLVVAEGFSSLSNILSIKSKKDVKNVDFVSILLHAVRKGLTNIVRKYILSISLGLEIPEEDLKEDENEKKQEE